MSRTDGRTTTSGTRPDEGDIAEVIALAGRRRRPAPVTEEWDWQMQAACRDLDSAVFFNPLGERGHEKLRRELHAKRVCGRCPVIDACRRHALRAQEPYGVWGGMTATERQELLTVLRLDPAED